MTKRKAVLAYSFSANNAGDFALSVAAVDILINQGFEVTIISRFRKNDKEFNDTYEYYKSRYGNIKMLESPFLLDREANIFKKTANNFHGTLVLAGAFANKQIDQAIKDTDIVVMGGGNLLRCGSLADYMRLQALYYPLNIARKYNKEFVIFPQSTAEVNKLGIPLLSKFMNGAKTVFLRENLSYSKMKLLFPDANIQEALDLAFFLQQKDSFKPSSEGRKRIAFTCRIDGIGGIRKFTEEEKKEVESHVIHCINGLKDQCSFTFVVQAPNRDKEFTQNLQNKIMVKYGYNIPIVEEHDPIKLIELYSSFDLLIGMRLHSIILAACGGTPSYGLFYKEWGLKNPGIMEILGLPFTMVDNKIDIDLKEADNLFQNKSLFQKKMIDIFSDDMDKIKKALS